jgi:uncharacterized membrane protein
MAFCPNCGAQVEGRFCAKCGAAVAAGPAPAGPDPGPAPGGYTPTPGGYVPPPPAAPLQSAGMADNMVAALCYLLTVITGILFLVLEPYNKNRLIRFHAFQAIFFWIACVAVYIVAIVLGITLGAIPVIGWIFGALLHLALGLGFFIVWLLLMYKAYNNEKWVLPVIGPLAEKQANS